MNYSFNAAILLIKGNVKLLIKLDCTIALRRVQNKLEDIYKYENDFLQFFLFVHIN